MMWAGGTGISLNSIWFTPQALRENLNIIYSTMCQLKPISPYHLFRKMTSCNFLPQHYISVILTNQSLLDHIILEFSLPIENRKVDLDLAGYLRIILLNRVRPLAVIKQFDSLDHGSFSGIYQMKGLAIYIQYLEPICVFLFRTLVRGISIVWIFRFFRV